MSSTNDDNDNAGDDGVDTVDDLRQKGNHEFQQGNLDNAVAFYTAAIEKASLAQAQAQGSSSASSSSASESPSPQSSSSSSSSSALIINFCNRSACYFQMEDYEKSRQDAQLAWTTSNYSNIKSAYRLAKTYIALDDYDKAIDVLTTCLTKNNNKQEGKSGEEAPTTTAASEKELQSLRDLLQQAQTKKNQKDGGSSKDDSSKETSIKWLDRPMSIREFKKYQTLGVGNFSEIVACEHRTTHEKFALKILEKKTAADLAKRQHPNVYNEIHMEARVLLQRIPPTNPHVVIMYHNFQDYNNLYYLMDLHNVNPDLWSTMRYQGSMVGCHRSQIQRWMMQLISAVEHCHVHGIVHRDLKPENVLLNANNHVVVIDFGTAKDLIETDLNGPEFVGTPDFMSPEAVTGFSGMPGQQPSGGKNSSSMLGDDKVATFASDLWALGAMAYILHTGSTPFWSPSPYLAFLRIKRGILQRSLWGIPNDDDWDFICQLMKVDPQQRLGADCFQVTDKKLTVAKGYDVLRSHPCFEGVDQNDTSTVLPSLQDLCLRACSELAKRDAVDLDICDQHPPGDGSKHDLTRMTQTQMCKVLHVLDKSKVFSNGDETRVFRRFYKSDLELVKAKVRPVSRDFVGLTQMNDDEYKPLTARGSQDPYATKIVPEPTKIVMLTNPMLYLGTDGGAVSPEDEKRYLKGWKNCIAEINKSRPKAVIVCAKIIPPKFWKFMSRIRDSIPVLWNDGTVFYNFWLNAFEGIVIQSSDLQSENSLQMKWLRERMEQSRMAKQKLFCFCDCDPRDLPPIVTKRLARGKTLCLMGLSNSGQPLDFKVKYEANEALDDNTSVKSTDSQEDADDRSTMRVYGGTNNGLRWLTVDEENDEWYSEFQSIPTPPMPE